MTTTLGGEVVLWQNGATVVRAAAEYCDETGMRRDEFYYRDGKLVFAYAARFNKDGKVMSPTASDEARVSRLVADAEVYRTGAAKAAFGPKDFELSSGPSR